MLVIFPVGRNQIKKDLSSRAGTDLKYLTYQLISTMLDKSSIFIQR